MDDPSSSAPPPLSNPTVEHLAAGEEEEQAEEGWRARSEWDFRLSTVVSPAFPREASDAIGAVEFDPTDRLLATAGIARKIRIYRLAALVPDDDVFITSDHAAAAKVCVCTPAKLSSLRWRPDAGGRVVASGDYDGVVAEYDVERSDGVGGPVSERDEHGGRRVWTIAYSSSGGLAASGSDDGTAQVWDPRSGSSAVAVFRAGAAVCAVEFDPAGGPQRLGLGSADRRARVYDLRWPAAAVAELAGHRRAVTYVRFAGGGRAVTSGADGTHRLWEWEHGKEVRVYSGHENVKSFVGLSVWGEKGLVGSGSESNEVFVYDLRWGEPVWVGEFGAREGPDGRGFVSAVSWRMAAGEEDGGALVAGGSNGVLKVFLATRKPEFCRTTE